MNATEAPTDEELFDRFRAKKDRAALEALYDRYLAPIVTFAARMTGEPAAARDVLQESWIRAIEHCRGWAPAWPFRTWLFRIVRNLCLDHLRARGVRLDHAEAAAATPIATEAAPNLSAADPLLLELFERAVLLLPPAQREVVLLRAQGFSFEEISEATQVNVNTVKSRMHQARKVVETFLEEHGYDGAP